MRPNAQHLWPRRRLGPAGHFDIRCSRGTVGFWPRCVCFRYDGLAFLVDEELIPWSPNRYLMSRQLTWAEARQPVQRKDATGDAMKMAYCDYYYAPTQPRAAGARSELIMSYPIRLYPI